MKQQSKSNQSSSHRCITSLRDGRAIARRQNLPREVILQLSMMIL